MNGYSQQFQVFLLYSYSGSETQICIVSNQDHQFVTTPNTTVRWGGGQFGRNDKIKKVQKQLARRFAVLCSFLVVMIFLRKWQRTDEIKFIFEKARNSDFNGVQRLSEYNKRYSLQNVTAQFAKKFLCHFRQC